MIVYESLKELTEPLQSPVLTIGNFDGVHRGHQALFNKTKERALAINGTTAVMTFDPHPSKVMRPHGNGPLMITPPEQKLELIKKEDIDVIFHLTFTKEFAKITPYGFVKDILIDIIGIKELVVGYDYNFGNNRSGNIELLKKLGEELAFQVHVLEPVNVQGSLVSSTSIRNLVKEGDLSAAKQLLGRDYRICGTVVKGKNRGGRLLGFPTANLETSDELTPKMGVYAVKAIIEDKIFKGVTNIGVNPTFGEGNFSIETHIIDYNGNLLGKILKLDFIKRLRDEKTFNSIDELSGQIKKDINNAMILFKQSES